MHGPQNRLTLCGRTYIVGHFFPGRWRQVYRQTIQILAISGTRLSLLFNKYPRGAIPLSSLKILKRVHVTEVEGVSVLPAHSVCGQVATATRRGPGDIALPGYFFFSLDPGLNPRQGLCVCFRTLPGGTGLEQTWGWGWRKRKIKRERDCVCVRQRWAPSCHAAPLIWRVLKLHPLRTFARRHGELTKNRDVQKSRVFMWVYRSRLYPPLSRSLSLTHSLSLSLSCSLSAHSHPSVQLAKTFESRMFSKFSYTHACVHICACICKCMITCIHNPRSMSRDISTWIFSANARTHTYVCTYVYVHVCMYERERMP